MGIGGDIRTLHGFESHGHDSSQSLAVPEPDSATSLRITQPDTINESKNLTSFQLLPEAAGYSGKQDLNRGQDLPGDALGIEDGSQTLGQIVQDLKLLGSSSQGHLRVLSAGDVLRDGEIVNEATLLVQNGPDVALQPAEVTVLGAKAKLH